MALYIPRTIFHLARLLYVRPETFGPTLVCFSDFIVGVGEGGGAAAGHHHHHPTYLYGLVII
jgi:hypothetical protein